MSNFNFVFQIDIISEAIGGVLAGIIIPLLLSAIYWFFSPRLKLRFIENKTYDEAPIMENNKLTGKIGLYIHLFVYNVHGKMAYNCKAFLIGIEQKIDCKYKPIEINVPLMLKWANESNNREYSGVEIPGKYYRRLDLIHGEKGEDKFLFFIESGPRGLMPQFNNGFPNGIYRIRIHVSAENAISKTKILIINWNGVFEKENIKIKAQKKYLIF